MIDAELRASIQRVLWPVAARESVWAVLDLARDPRIYGVLLESRLEFLCLYSGRLPRELERVAPHIVELLPGHRLLDRLLDDGWGKSWGVFVKTADQTNLRHHLRRFLKVRSESGRPLLFRYYDPRVLRAYLPSCTAGELATFFGPLHSWVVEGESGGSLIEYSRVATGTLQRSETPMGA